MLGSLYCRCTDYAVVYSLRLPIDYEPCVYVDTCLGEVPCHGGTVGVVGAVATTIVSIFGVEDIVQLAEQAYLRYIGLVAPRVHRQLVL